MTALRATARLVLRGLVRERRASAASALLLAVAVALLVGYATIAASSDVSLNTRVARALGGADARVAVVRPTPPGVSLAGLTDSTSLARALGPGVSLAPLVETPTRFAVGDRSVAATATLGDFTSPLVQPLLRLRSGRWPTAAGEATISSALAERLGVGKGASLRPAAGAGAVTVVGVLVDPVDTRAALAVLPADEASFRSVRTGDQVQASVVFLVRASPAQLRDSGLPYLDRQQVVDRAAEPRAGNTLGLVVAAALVACVAVAVLGLAARRQWRTAALLDLLGADVLPRLLVPTATLLLLAVTALLLGGGLGFGAAAAALPLLAQRAGQAWASPRLPAGPLALVVGVVALAVLGVILATGLALRRWGARAVLAGRETTTGRPPWRWTSVAAGVAALGMTAGWVVRQPALVVLASLVLAVAVSGVAVTGACAVLRLAGGPVWLSLAVRNLQRLSSIPRTLVGTLAAFAAASTFAALLLTSLTLSTGYVPQLPRGGALFSSEQQLTDQDVDRARAQLGADRSLQFRDVIRSSGGLRSYLQVRNPLQECLRGDSSGSTRGCAERTGWPVLSPRVSFLAPDQVETYLGHPLAPDDRRAYEAGSALVLFPALLQGGRVTVWAGPSAEGSLGGGSAPADADDTIDLPGRAVPSAMSPSSDGPAVLVPPRLAGQRGLTFGAAWNVLFLGQAVPDAAQEDTARSLLIRAAAGVGTLSVERGDPHLPLARAVVRTATLSVGVFGSVAAGLLALLVTATLRRENAVLDAVGAGSGGRRAAATLQVLLPTAVALPLGALPGALAARWCAGFEHADLVTGPLVPLALAGLVALGVAGVAAAVSTARRPGPPRQPA